MHHYRELEYLGLAVGTFEIGRFFGLSEVIALAPARPHPFHTTSAASTSLAAAPPKLKC